MLQGSALPTGLVTAVDFHKSHDSCLGLEHDVFGFEDYFGAQSLLALYRRSDRANFEKEQRAHWDNYVDEEDDDQHRNTVSDSADIALFSITRGEAQCSYDGTSIAMEHERPHK
ncbi:hypothetical protein D9C73_027115 [Collichthys lucidus]|uniref:Uncharacterized protein n=1 Tax=Collichthys lucidus TaxID=240159 RepID=A0A4U5VVR7_COLLU|nr:hypothetical protein D9C73_027115 [Collichthys lucidus]